MLYDFQKAHKEKDVRVIKVLLLSLFICFWLVHAAVAQDTFANMLKGLSNLGGLTSPSSAPSSNVAQGLKVALRIGTENAVGQTGQTDGYYANPLIKILLPKKFKTLETGLRFAGYGSTVDEFVLSMNRAAEAAAPQAQSIFINAITSMTIDDANTILQGGDTAATDFFKTKTSSDLYTAFRPIIDTNLNKLRTVQRYKTLTSQARTLPLMKSHNLDVGDYVTNQALDGLFKIVAADEKNIRQNPSARVTSLLRDVFQ